MAMNVEAEIRDLKRRVGEIEGSFGFVTQQLKSVHKDLLTFQAKTEQRFDAIDEKFEAADARFDKVDGRLDRLDTGLRQLRDDMPGIVGDAMRTVMRARREAAQAVSKRESVDLIHEGKYAAEVLKPVAAE